MHKFQYKFCELTSHQTPSLNFSVNIAEKFITLIDFISLIFVGKIYKINENEYNTFPFHKLLFLKKLYNVFLYNNFQYFEIDFSEENIESIQEMNANQNNINVTQNDIDYISKSIITSTSKLTKKKENLLKIEQELECIYDESIRAPIKFFKSLKISLYFVLEFYIF
jgi:hypothetical protein